MLGHSNTAQSEEYVALADVDLIEFHAEHSALLVASGMRPAVAEPDLPKVVLPNEVEDVDLCDDGRYVKLLVATHRQGDRFVTKILCRRETAGDGTSSKVKTVAVLGELPLNYVDAYRLAIANEDQRRRQQYADRIEATA